MAFDDTDKQWIKQQLEALETKLLSAFYTWAQPVELRQSTHREAIRAVDIEIENFKKRVAALEGRPPQ